MRFPGEAMPKSFIQVARQRETFRRTEGQSNPGRRRMTENKPERAGLIRKQRCGIPDVFALRGRAIPDAPHSLPGRAVAPSLPRSGFRQFHSTLELRWLVILDPEIGVIQCSDPFYLIVGELWAFRTRREFGELLFIVNVRER